MPSIHVCRKSRTTMRTAGLLLSIIIAIGCDSGPRAPALMDTPVFHDKQEGFRFLVPDGWTQSARANLPTGQLEGESFLVRYRMKTPEMGAALQIICFDASEQTDLAEHLAGPSFRVRQWNATEPGESIDVNGKPAERFVHEAVIDGRKMTKETACFRKGNRVYCFVGLFFASDDKAREQIRRAVGSVIWEQ